ncbi:MAG: F0F1 ATP synthase subunit epsilon [Clostridiales bacterium]|nr:F0F1 ATP synthase subunit epsilon [Clostridiales bacterium]
MAKTFPLEIFTPERLFYWGDAELVICRTLSGEEGFMADHCWGCKLLDIGELWFRENDQKEYKLAAVSGGYIDIRDRILVFTDAAEWPEEIVTDRANEAVHRAEDWLAQHGIEDRDPDETAQHLRARKRAQNRLAVAAGGVKPRR